MHKLNDSEVSSLRQKQVVGIEEAKMIKVSQTFYNLQTFVVMAERQLYQC